MNKSCIPAVRKQKNRKSTWRKLACRTLARACLTPARARNTPSAEQRTLAVSHNTPSAVCLALAAVCLALAMLCGCTADEPKEPDFSNAQNIAKLATFECTYHNVAKIEKDSDKWLIFDLPNWKREWFEYSATVSFGINADLVQISSIDENGNVTIAIPQAQVLGTPNIKAETMSDPIDDTGWFTEVTDEERKEALSLAQQETLERACADDTMLAAARDRAKVLLEQYVKNVGASLGEDYHVTWVDTE